MDDSLLFFSFIFFRRFGLMNDCLAILNGLLGIYWLNQCLRNSGCLSISLMLFLHQSDQFIA